MDLSFLQKFSGGLDLLPVVIAIAGLISMRKAPKPAGIEERTAYVMATICFIALPIAQIGWVAAVIRGVPYLGSLLDNVWTVYNFGSLGAMLILIHSKRRE